MRPPRGALSIKVTVTVHSSVLRKNPETKSCSSHLCSVRDSPVRLSRLSEDLEPVSEGFSEMHVLVLFVCLGAAPVAALLPFGVL